MRLRSAIFWAQCKIVQKTLDKAEPFGVYCTHLVMGCEGEN